MKIYLPQNLDLRSELIKIDNNHPWLKTVRYNKLLYVIHKIVVHTQNKKADNEEFVNLKMKYLQNVIGTSFAKDALDILILGHVDKLFKELTKF